MPVVISDDSELGKELKRWDTPRSQGGMRPDTPQMYPFMLYRAWERHGKVMCMDALPMFGLTPAELSAAQIEVETFNKSCQLVVRSESEHAIAKGQGWHDSAKAAVEAYHKQLDEIGNLAAKRAFSDQFMGLKAQEEIRAVEQETHEHVLDVVPAK